MPDEREVPKDIARHLRTWELSALAWQISLVVLAAGGIICALAVTGFVESLGNWARVLAFISAASFALISGLNMAKLAANFRTAWRHLNGACMRYRRLETFTMDQLIDAYEEGERIIGHIEIHPDARGSIETSNREANKKMQPTQ